MRTLTVGVVVLLFGAGCIATCGAPAEPDLAHRIVAICTTWPCRVRMDEVVPQPWDTMWAANSPREESFESMPGMHDIDRTRLAEEWRGSMGSSSLLLLTSNGAVVWQDECDNNINENFDPPLCWVALQQPDSHGWSRLSRAQAVFDVERRVGTQDNSLLLQPTDANP